MKPSSKSHPPPKTMPSSTTTMTTQIQVRPLPHFPGQSNPPSDSEISDASDLATLTPDETLLDRLYALRDIIPPKTRATLSSTASTLYNATSTGITFGGKGIWILTTSVLLLGIPYALALGEEQQLMEEERQRGMMAEGAQGMIGGAEEGKPAL
jgi:mitochondrial import receptor subunit TOM22